MSKQKTHESIYLAKLSTKDAAIKYAKLREDVTAAGILQRAYFYYTFLILFVVSGFLASAYFIYTSQHLFTTFLSAVMFVFFAAQITGLFHDSGHRAIFKSARNNDIIGYIACALIAYTYKKWRVNHNRHHANPNEEDMDPDIERPLFAYSANQIKSKKGIARWFTKYQAFSYFPAGALTGIYSQVANIFYFLKEYKKVAAWEIVVYAVGLFSWVILPFFLFDLAKLALIYLTVYPLLGFYLFNIFAPNHKGMPQVSKSQQISFLEQQIITARNVKPNFYINFLLMGLNYQIEHHLFPECPRNKLRLMTPYVKKLCEEVGLDYTEVSLIKSNKIILSELNRVALSA